MHEESYTLPASACETINAARAAGGRIIAVGTTSARVLESQPPGALKPRSGETGIFIYPPYHWKHVDALITNFHLPRSTLVMLVAAFCSPGQTQGRQTILDAYAQAARQGYRFFSYGDAMLIE